MKFGNAARGFLHWRHGLLHRAATAHEELLVLSLPADERHVLQRVGCNDPLWWHDYLQASGPGARHALAGFVPCSVAVESAIVTAVAHAAREHLAFHVSAVYEHIGDCWREPVERWGVDMDVAEAVDAELSHLVQGRLLARLSRDVFQVRVQVGPDALLAVRHARDEALASWRCL
ncbi:hypothetical protein [Cupriavidus sp. HMR-1]|uniref:hypothetical protein n=1 Tax=Cupriavidus sp. HMR-1 TaxID=1249621 RepID=UPI0012672E02|nr:hypothetical protein [Cupriavidus sp. HMR-1]